MFKDDRLLVTLFLAQMLTIMHYKPLWLFVFLLACRYFLFPFLLEFVKEIGNIRVLAINVSLVFIFVFTL